MSKAIVYAVGGRGYIGQRWVEDQSDTYDVRVIDPGYTVKDTPNPNEDVTSEPFNIPQEPGIVIWFPCIHRLPESCYNGPWRSYAYKLMVQVPQLWLAAGHKMIYMSSMQAVTAPFQDLYAHCKRRFEHDRVGTPGLRIIRPGTVWGGLRKGDRTNRTQTVVNRYINTGKLPDENWEAYTSDIHTILDVLDASVDQAVKGELPGDVLCPTDLNRPCKWRDLLDIPDITYERSAMIERVGPAGLAETEHPMQLLAQARGLDWRP